MDKIEFIDNKGIDMKSCSPFKVPEGYFDKLHDDIMGKIAEQQAVPDASLTIEYRNPSKSRQLRVSFFARVAAACVCALVVFSTVLYIINDKEDAVSVAEMQVENDEAFAEAAEYAMLDNHDYYQFFEESDM